MPHASACTHSARPAHRPHTAHGTMAAAAHTTHSTQRHAAYTTHPVWNPAGAKRVAHLHLRSLHHLRLQLRTQHHLDLGLRLDTMLLVSWTALHQVSRKHSANHSMLQALREHVWMLCMMQPRRWARRRWKWAGADARNETPKLALLKFRHCRILRIVLFGFAQRQTHS